jgi:hypothetical protein
MEQLTMLSVEPGDQDSTAKSLAALKSELAREKLKPKRRHSPVQLEN